MERNSSRLRNTTYGALFIICLFLAWELIVAITGRHTVVPYPHSITRQFGEEIRSADFFATTGSTLLNWIAALTIGLLVGSIVAVVAGVNKTVLAFIAPTGGFLRALPPITVFPIAIIAFGPGRLAIIVVAAVGAAAYVFPSTSIAVSESANKFRELAFTLRCTRLQFIKLFIVPGAGTQLIAASRTAATYAFAICVAAEMVIGGTDGIGAAILNYSYLFQLEKAYAFVIFAGLVGILIDVLFGSLTRLPVFSEGAR